MKVLYLISSIFDYSKVIAGDVGPLFAADYGLKAVTLASDELASADYVIVDNRFDPSEFADLARHVKQTRATTLLKVVDPYYQHRDSGWYRFVEGLVDHPGVHLALTYTPSELTALYLSRAEKTKCVFMPYVYNEEREVPLDHAGRMRRLALSGGDVPDLYPVRARMVLLSRLWPPFWFLVDRLEHPGYPDIGQSAKHEVLGERYVEWLALHRFAFVCSSRCRLEFLKYREVAYAGCVPVGDMPYTLLDCPENARIGFGSNPFRLTRELMNCDGTEAAAMAYRGFLRDRRAAPKMRERLFRQLARLS